MEVAVLDDYQRAVKTAADWSRLPAGTELTVFHDLLADAEGLARRLLPFEVLVPLRERTYLDRELLSRLPALRLIVNAGMRPVGIDIEAATEQGVVVCGTTFSSEAPVQLAWALILGLARRIAEEDRALRDGHWGTTLGIDLTGKTLGLLGLGRIGRRMAEVGRAFGLHVIAWSQNLTTSHAAACGAQRVPKDDLFRDADVLSVHLRLSSRTRGIVGAHELALMQPTALFINTARGAIVDESALTAALVEGRIGGAGLDVFQCEPLPSGHPLRTLPNTLLTPHIGYVTDARYRLFYDSAIDRIAAFAAGSPEAVLNPDALGRDSQGAPT